MTESTGDYTVLLPTPAISLGVLKALPLWAGHIVVEIFAATLSAFLASALLYLIKTRREKMKEESRHLVERAAEPAQALLGSTSPQGPLSRLLVPVPFVGASLKPICASFPDNYSWRRLLAWDAGLAASVASYVAAGQALLELHASARAIVAETLRRETADIPQSNEWSEIRRASAVDIVLYHACLIREGKRDGLYSFVLRKSGEGTVELAWREMILAEGPGESMEAMKSLLIRLPESPDVQKLVDKVAACQEKLQDSRGMLTRELEVVIANGPRRGRRRA